MHLLNFPLLRHPRCVLYSHHPVFCLYGCFNIKSIVGSLFFFCIRGEGCVVQDGPTPPPALAPCIPGSYSLLISSSPYFILFYLFFYFFFRLHCCIILLPISLPSILPRDLSSPAFFTSTAPFLPDSHHPVLPHYK